VIAQSRIWLAGHHGGSPEKIRLDPHRPDHRERLDDPDISGARAAAWCPRALPAMGLPADLWIVVIIQADADTGVGVVGCVRGALTFTTWPLRPRRTSPWIPRRTLEHRPVQLPSTGTADGDGDAMNRPVLLTVHQAAEFLALRESTVRHYARRGVLPSIRIGRHVRFIDSDLLAWLASLNEGEVQA
jgi:excisionase family DNA binding protein